MNRSIAQAAMTSQIGVVINTFNRAQVLRNAVESVLMQTPKPDTIVVVDDGSDDSTPQVLQSFKRENFVVVRHPNSGLCFSRNTGAGTLTTEWIIFLDDDDHLTDDALTIFAEHISPDVGLIVAGVRRVTEQNRVISEDVPSPLYDFFDRCSISVMPGSFCLRREIFEEVGGYLEDLLYGHQTELLLRYWAAMRLRGLRLASDTRVALEYTVRDAKDRPMQNPCYTALGAARLLANQPWLIDKCPEGYAHVARVGAVAATRIGDTRLSRVLFHLCLRAKFLGPTTLLRAVVARLPKIRELVWPDFRRPNVGLDNCLPRQSPSFFLPFGYSARVSASTDQPDRRYWDSSSKSDPQNQWPVYRLARRLARRSQVESILDIGCGTGTKLVRLWNRRGPALIGVDQASGLEAAKALSERVTWIVADLNDADFWHRARRLSPGLILCADVIEHVDDPYLLLEHIRRTCTPTSTVVISTPDRRRLELANQMGPPTNPRHTREWTPLEFELLVRSAGFHVERSYRRLPRGYSLSISTAKRLLWRLLHGKAIPDARSSMIFRLTPR